MSWLLAIEILAWVMRLGMVPVILRRRLPPPTATAWLAVIFLSPWIGVPIYVLFGDARLGRRRAKRYRSLIKLTRSTPRLSQQQRDLLEPHIDPASVPVAMQADRVGGMAVLGGNSVTLHNEAGAVIDGLIADIDAAKRHVHLLFYIFADDQTGQRVADALIRAAARGVRVRLLADAAGSWGFFFGGLADRLTNSGVAVSRCMPVTLIRRRLRRLDLRNHRKLAIIDGSAAWTGSQNIVDATYGPKKIGSWLDLMGRFTGPIVTQLQMVFLDDWSFETSQDVRDEHLFPALIATGQTLAQTVPTGPGEDADSLPRVLVAAINLAKKRVVITTPYLVPDEPTFLALALAADRGVDVSIVVPKRSDHWLVTVAGRAHYEPLLTAGVNVHIHQQGLLHAKTMSVDDSFALLGSANLDIRSFYINFELNVLLYGPQITTQLLAVQQRYIDQSTPLRLEQWRRRSALVRYAENAASLLSPIL
jgi:cardiolipin synthase A/B